MSAEQEYEPQLVSITDDNGEEFVMELIGLVEEDGSTYGVFQPFEEIEDDDEDDIDVVIMKVLEDGDEMQLESVADDELADKILKAFTEMVESEN